ncbi:MAG: GreA/GreB family elongation factor [Verrucomicrobiota bacterium]
MKKNALIKKIVAELLGELELYSRAADAARAEATDEQSKAESKYDTRGLEASYLARGQSRRITETERAIKEIEALPLRQFGPQDPIDLGALVELEARDEQSYYFLAPCAGGTEVTHDKKEILVITPQSPLGEQLMGRKQGDRLKIEIAGTRDEYRVVSVK